MLTKVSKIDYFLIKLTIFFAFISTLLEYTFINGSFQLGATTELKLIFSIFSFVVFFRLLKRNKINFISKQNLFFLLFLLYVLISSFRGFIFTNDYYILKYLIFYIINIVTLSLLFFVGKNFAYQIISVNFFLKRILPLTVLLSPIILMTNIEIFGRISYPICYYLLIIIYKKNKSFRFYLIAIVLVSILFDITYRINIFSLLFSILLVLTHKTRLFNFIKKQNKFLFLFLPLIMIYLGTKGNNIFDSMTKMNETVVFDVKQKKNVKYLNDSRTFLYEEVIKSNLKSKGLIFGVSPAQGYETGYFDLLTKSYGKNIRLHTEVANLNIFLHHGLFGLLLFICFIFNTINNCFKKSQNKLALLTAMIISWQFFMGFLSNSWTYGIRDYFFWLILGLISSKEFLNMNDFEIKKYLNIKSND